MMLKIKVKRKSIPLPEQVRVVHATVKKKLEKYATCLAFWMISADVSSFEIKLEWLPGLVTAKIRLCRSTLLFRTCVLYSPACNYTKTFKLEVQTECTVLNFMVQTRSLSVFPKTTQDFTILQT
ncbi:hypothetical protein L915_20471 [Phytophthora nicotianae]|uniref:Uncharacterized protein n=1 Tax=Phytophthora nicotianae TaxID=4792 RepID=W2MA21_PHYNI|nr:hypothetical protein L915_20471 [Phytophthora nicotianae]ETM32359.1 hypothetical protein L914_20222 [Phytophthora nicotianae]